jgi:hypothetical protein
MSSTWNILDTTPKFSILVTHITWMVQELRWAFEEAFSPSSGPWYGQGNLDVTLYGFSLYAAKHHVMLLRHFCYVNPFSTKLQNMSVFQTYGVHYFCYILGAIPNEFRSIKPRLTVLETRCADSSTPLYIQKLALTLLTVCGHLVGRFRLRTRGHRVCFVYLSH